VSLETQDWWTKPGNAVEGMSQHIHLATCFPLDQTLKGTVPFDIHIQLHMNPGVLTVVDLQVFGNSVSESQVAAKPNFTCPTTQCDLWYHLDYDTTKVPADGALEFRFHAKVTSPDGTVGYTSSGWQAVLANGGRPVQNYRKPPWIEARGWYTGTEYENARFTSPLPSGPLQGTWTFNVSLGPGSGGTPVDHVLVSVDPHFHFDPVDRGNVIFEKAGPYVGPIAIDTTKLSNGVHRLFMRSDSTVPAGVGSGVMAFNFSVNNPATGLLGSLKLASDAVQTSLPVLPWLIVLVFLAMIMPRRSARQRAAAAVASQPAEGTAVGPAVGSLQRMEAGGLDVGPGALSPHAAEPAATAPIAEPAPVVVPRSPVFVRPIAAVVAEPRRAPTVEPGSPAVVAPPAAATGGQPVPVTAAEPTPSVVAETVVTPVVLPMPMTREAAWAEYRRATSAATSREAAAAATLAWVRAVDRIKRAELSPGARGTERQH
jgi:hypothetical protein